MSGACPLHLRLRLHWCTTANNAMCHKQTYAVQQRGAHSIQSSHYTHDEANIEPIEPAVRCVNLSMCLSNECGLRLNLGRMDFMGVSANIMALEPR